MRISFSIPIIVCLLTFSPLVGKGGDEKSRKVLLEYFFQTGCRECRLIDDLVLPPLQERYSGFYELKKFDIGVKENFIKLAYCQDKLGVTGDEPVSIIVDGKIALDGYGKIESGLFDAIDSCLAEIDDSNEPAAKAAPAVENIDERSLLKRRSKKMTLAAVIAAGLIDGINPCVFATLIFLVSLLSTSRFKGKPLLAVGIFYCLACFLAYFAIGFGLFKFLRGLSAFPMVSKDMSHVMVAILGLLALLSFRDAWRYRKTGKASDVVLQLPDKVKAMIHGVMRKGLGIGNLAVGAFAVGVVVTALESVCTGQVYVPTLVMLIKESGDGLVWLAYLTLYNVVFIVPLLAVFAAAWLGLGNEKLRKLSSDNVVLSKILMGLLFVFLGAVIALY